MKVHHQIMVMRCTPTTMKADLGMEVLHQPVRDGICVDPPLCRGPSPTLYVLYLWVYCSRNQPYRGAARVKEHPQLALEKRTLLARVHELNDRVLGFDREDLHEGSRNARHHPRAGMPTICSPKVIIGASTSSRPICGTVTSRTSSKPQPQCRSSHTCGHTSSSGVGRSAAGTSSSSPVQ